MARVTDARVRETASLYAAAPHQLPLQLVRQALKLIFFDFGCKLNQPTTFNIIDGKLTKRKWQTPQSRCYLPCYLDLSIRSGTR